MGENGESDGGEAESDGDVIFADRLSAAEIISLKDDEVKAVVLKTGTATSHAAVILRSMGITAVFGVNVSSHATAIVHTRIRLRSTPIDLAIGTAHFFGVLGVRMFMHVPEFHTRMVRVEVAQMALRQFREKIPVLFDDVGTLD